MTARAFQLPDIPLIRPAGHLLPASGAKENRRNVQRYLLAPDGDVACFVERRGMRTGRARHVPSPRLRGEGAGRRMRGNRGRRSRYDHDDFRLGRPGIISVIDSDRTHFLIPL
ncbi:hypothetical protein CDO27_16985 [Sinorhizobium meliloti]|nr:hypothetical protein CDO27_16985 [Sinorhizobium meliloti]